MKKWIKKSTAIILTICMSASGIAPLAAEEIITDDVVSGEILDTPVVTEIPEVSETPISEDPTDRTTEDDTVADDSKDDVDFDDGLIIDDEDSTISNEEETVSSEKDASSDETEKDDIENTEEDTEAETAADSEIETSIPDESESEEELLIEEETESEFIVNDELINGEEDEKFYAGAAEVEQEVYLFCINELGLNIAATCAVLANISHESSFNPNDIGDGGTSYGLCQWHNERWDALKAYRPNDWTTSTGQLAYLKHEFETTERNAWNNMDLLNIPNTLDGAVLAARRWAEYFERCAVYYCPIDKTGYGYKHCNSCIYQYGQRETTARDIYWPKYAGAVDPTSFYYSSPGVNPQGCLDIAEGGNGTLHIRGWAFDRNSDEPLTIHVYVGGSAASGQAIWSAGDVIANKTRTDVNDVFPGAGNNHGFEETFNVPFTGTYQVYVYAINVGGKGTSSNYNTLLDGAPKEITVGSQNAYLDVNSIINGQKSGSLENIAAVDVWINYGLVARNVNDYYAQWPVGTPYKIELSSLDTDHYIYDGAVSGSVEGVIGANNTEVVLGFSTRDYKITFHLNGGSCDDDLINNKYVSANGTYGALPIPYRDGCTFNGWHTGIYTGDNNVSGTEVMYDTPFLSDELYASWLIPPFVSVGPSRDWGMEYNGHEYHVYDMNMSWTEAQNFCSQMNGHLVTINDYDELEAVKGLIASGRMGCYYIGTSDSSFEGNWRWVNGDTFDYQNWGYGEGNGGLNENYAAIINKGSTVGRQTGTWIDIPNKYTGPDFYHYSNCGFIFEKDFITISLFDPGISVNLIKDTYPLTNLAPALELEVSYNGKMLKQYQDYYIVYQDVPPIKVGTYKFDIEGTGRYRGTRYGYTIHIVDPSDMIYTIEYNLNGGEGYISPQQKKGGEAIKLSTIRPVRRGHYFHAWSLSPDFLYSEYNPGDTYSADEDVTLYAIWHTILIKISYDANGGINAPPDQYKEYGSIQTLSTQTPTRTGYTFLGWARKAEATAAEYQPGASYAENAAIKLYAVWKNNTADYTKVDTALKKIPSNLSLYTDASVKAVTDAKAAVKRGLPAGQQSSVDTMATAIENAVKRLAYKPADYSKVDTALKKIPANLSQYTDTTVKKVIEAKNAVKRGYNITQQAAVNAMATAIENAVKGLVKKPAAPAKVQLIAAYNGAHGIGVKWIKLTGATEYTIWQKYQGVWRAIAVLNPNDSSLQVSGNTLMYTDKAVKSGYGKGYIYSVSAKVGNTTVDFDRTGAAIYRLNPPTLKSAKNSEAGQAVVTWKGVFGKTETNGAYDLQYATEANAKAGKWTNAKKLPGFSYNVTSATIGGLKKGTKYIFRIRCSKTNKDRGTFYSEYSPWLSVTIKK